MRFRFSPLKKELVFDKLRSVADEEGVSYNDEGLQAILQLSNGDMRKCLNTLQATSLAYPLVDEKNVYICTGNASPGEMRQILDVLLNSNFSETYECNYSQHPTKFFIMKLNMFTQTWPEFKSREDTR